MGRPVVLSNGQLFVGLDEHGLVHDFYYPYVGLDNLTNARSTQHKIGIWVDGSFSWTNDGSWQVSVDFEPGALVSDIRLRSDQLGIELKLLDFVDSAYNAFIRCITVTNLFDKQRDIRVFMHQVFQISRAGRADTAMYVPDDHYLLDYKGRCCLLMAAKIVGGPDFDQYAVGSYAIEGKAGTFMDAEDGELSGNPIEHGGVDSVLRLQHTTGPQGSFEVNYWLVAADSQSDAQVVHTRLKYYPMADRLLLTREYWREWLEPSKERLEQIPLAYRVLAQKSMLVIKAHCDDRGSILASGDSSIFNFGRDYYCYCWPRDAAYALWPLIRMGQFAEARKFFAFARDTMHRGGYMMHKYQPDRSIGSTWHPLVHGKSKELAIQEDETAIVVFMIGEFYRASQDKAFIESLYDTFISPCADFMTGFIDSQTGLPHASYDLWEERFLTSTYTVCVVIAGLETAAELAGALGQPADATRWQEAADAIRGGLDALYHPDGYFRKGFLLQENGDLLYDDTLDISSFFGPYMYAALPQTDPRMTGMLARVTDRIVQTTPIGGVLRSEHDYYFLAKQQYRGNPWIVCSLWLAQYYISTRDLEKATVLIDWAVARATPSGMLSEQFDPEDGHAISVTPLVWSHAEFINTMIDFAKVSGK